MDGWVGGWREKICENELGMTRGLRIYISMGCEEEERAMRGRGGGGWGGGKSLFSPPLSTREFPHRILENQAMKGGGRSAAFERDSDEEFQPFLLLLSLHSTPLSLFLPPPPPSFLSFH